MKRDIELVNIYEDGYETHVMISYDDAALLVSDENCDYQCVYARVNEKRFRSGDNVQLITVTGTKFAPKTLPQLTCSSPVEFDDGTIRKLTISDEVPFKLTKIICYCSTQEEHPDTTGLYRDRNGDIIWFDLPNEYYTLIANSNCDYLHGLSYTPKPPFTKIIDKNSIIKEDEE